MTSQSFVLEHRAGTASRLVLKAAECGGLAFGGYVRDWVLRQRPFKDLDLWFQDTEHADQFLTKVAESKRDMIIRNSRFAPLSAMSLSSGVGSVPRFVAENNALEYPFQRMQLHVGTVQLDNDDGVFVDLIVSREFPVNDFDVNQLCFDGTRISGGTPDTDAAAVTRSILQGRARLLPAYASSYAKKDRVTLMRVETMRNRKGFHLENIDSNSTPVSAAAPISASASAAVSKANQEEEPEIKTEAKHGGEAPKLTEDLHPSCSSTVLRAASELREGLAASCIVL
jgi:hypothetical protein